MKDLPVETKKFYDAAKESIILKKLTISEIRKECTTLRRNGFKEAVTGIEIALSETSRRSVL